MLTFLRARARALKFVSLMAWGVPSLMLLLFVPSLYIDDMNWGLYHFLGVGDDMWDGEERDPQQFVRPLLWVGAILGNFIVWLYYFLTFTLQGSTDENFEYDANDATSDEHTTTITQL